MPDPRPGTTKRVPTTVRGLSAAALAAAMAMAVGLTSGCSGGEERAYRTPSDLCGTAVPADALEPFLPGGEKVAVKEEQPAEDTLRCRVSVDGEQVFVASLELRERRGGVFQLFGLNAGMKDGGPAEGDDDLMYTERGAVSRLKGCATPDDDKVLYTSLEVLPKDVGDAQAMRRLATAYTKEAQQSDMCRGQG
ncbi:hypothetical protein [Streptomyces abyssomicinicus]|uniref:hypothetical protein n=1 Tax=Streptomyces abyssomicinicus TaxID=574929 RepID=UPI0013E032F1|nr:hypothetical protein [Streptomyces abyssomicinicus]